MALMLSSNSTVSLRLYGGSRHSRWPLALPPTFSFPLLEKVTSLHSFFTLTRAFFFLPSFLPRPFLTIIGNSCAPVCYLRPDLIARLNAAP